MCLPNAAHLVEFLEKEIFHGRRLRWIQAANSLAIKPWGRLNTGLGAPAVFDSSTRETRVQPKVLLPGFD